MRITSRLVGAIIATVVGAVLPFGSVYPWAYWPVLIVVTAIAVWVGLTNRTLPIRWSVVALLLAPLVIQLVPLPRDLLTFVAPSHMKFLERSVVASVAAVPSAHPISVAPVLTQHVFLFVAVGICWTGAIASALRRSIAVDTLTRGLMAAGGVLALFALVQRGTFNEKIYWFWQSPAGVASNYFGPFVNRNHFAGWMVLAIGLGTGYLNGLLASATRAKRQDWRSLTLWFGSAEATRIVHVCLLLAVMIVSVLWSRSRSGMTGTFVAILVVALTSIAGMPTRTRSYAAAVLPMALVAGAVAWRGLDPLIAWFGDTSTMTWRFNLWRDSMAPMKDFWPWGAGVNTYGAVMLFYPQSDPVVHAAQAHNDYVQLAVEGGLLVPAAWTTALIVIAHQIVLRFRQAQAPMTWWIRLGAVGGLVGLAVQEATDFSLQIPAVALLFATVVAVALHEPANFQPRH